MGLEQKLKGAAKALGLVAAMALGGCMGSFGSKPTDKSAIGYEFTAYLDATRKKFDVKEKYVPVHPSDAGFLSGGTGINAADGAVGDVAIGLRGALHAGCETISAKAGVDIFGDGFYAYEVKQQQSDSRPNLTGSCLYDELSLSTLVVSPFAGLRVTPSKDFELEADFGPRLLQTYEREWGHHRWNSPQKIGESKGDVDGARIRCGLILYFDKHFGFGLNYTHDWLELKGEGKAAYDGVALVLKVDF